MPGCQPGIRGKVCAGQLLRQQELLVRIPERVQQECPGNRQKLGDLGVLTGAAVTGAADSSSRIRIRAG